MGRRRTVKNGVRPAGAQPHPRRKRGKGETIRQITIPTELDERLERITPASLAGERMASRRFIEAAEFYIAHAPRIANGAAGQPALPFGGERGAGSGEQGMGNGERGTGSGGRPDVSTTSTGGDS